MVSPIAGAPPTPLVLERCTHRQGVPHSSELVLPLGGYVLRIQRHDPQTQRMIRITGR